VHESHRKIRSDSREELNNCNKQNTKYTLIRIFGYINKLPNHNDAERRIPNKRRSLEEL